MLIRGYLESDYCNLQLVSKEITFPYGKETYAKVFDCYFYNLFDKQYRLKIISYIL